MNRFIQLGLLLALNTSILHAQIGPTGGKDTSFSVRGSYLREKKLHPNITLADSTLPTGVRTDKSIPYSSPIAGRNLLLDVYQPVREQGKTYPAVVMIHGGGWRLFIRNLAKVMIRSLRQRLHTGLVIPKHSAPTYGRKLRR